MNSIPTIDGPCWLCGDIHSEPRAFFRALKQADVRNATIILLGDIGVGFSRKPPEYYFEPFSRLLREQGNRPCLLRGNHDNPAFWESPLREQIEARWENVCMLQQGPLEINGELYFVYPGAVSLDRRLRQEGLNWFHGEQMVPATLPDLGRPYRGILGHAGPLPPGVSHRGLREHSAEDKALYRDIETEDELMECAIAQLHALNAARGCVDVPSYYHGHFHQSWQEEVLGVRGHCIDICELCRLS